MGRGYVSKSIRKQNRANLSGNPTRGNPFTGEGLPPGTRQAKIGQNAWDNHRGEIQKMIIWENRHYRVSYMHDGLELVVLGIVCYFDQPTRSGNYSIITHKDPISNIIAQKLLITLRVEDAQRSQGQ